MICQVQLCIPKAATEELFAEACCFAKESETGIALNACAKSNRNQDFLISHRAPCVRSSVTENARALGTILLIDWNEWCMRSKPRWYYVSHFAGKMK